MVFPTLATYWALNQIPDEIICKIEKQNVAISGNIATYSSIILGFLLTGFAVLMSYSEKEFFKAWKKSGGLAAWKLFYILSLISNFTLLVLSFALLICPNFIAITFSVMTFSLLDSALVFLPVFNAALRPVHRWEKENSR